MSLPDLSNTEGVLDHLRQWANNGSSQGLSTDATIRLALLRGAVALGAISEADLPRDVNPEVVPAKATPTEDAPFLTAILPVYNEQENLPTLITRLIPVLESIGTYEVIFVNDGSKDSSVPIILEAREHNPRIKLLDLSRNFGHQAALSAGLSYARGQVITLLDADLQDPPESLPLLIDKWKEGYHVVYAVREKRKEGIFKRSAYHVFYRILQRVASIPIPLDSGDFCLMDRRVVDEVVRLPERNRFLRGLRSWVGFKQIGVSYERAARFAGEPKYTFTKLVKLALDGLVAFTTEPLRLATHAGGIVAAIGVLYLIYIVISRILGISSPPGWTSLAAIILLVGGIQLVVLGVLGEYIGRIYEESKGRPEFIVGKSYGAVEPEKIH
jgi:dolichol-phosphate mannosyltransferase